MSLWVVRAGKHGEQEETAIKEHLVCHAWNELPDYSSYRTKDDLRALYKQTIRGKVKNRSSRDSDRFGDLRGISKRATWLRCLLRSSLISPLAGSRANTSTRRSPQT